VVALRTLFSVRRAGVHHVISALYALNSYEFVASSNEIRALGPLGWGKNCFAYSILTF
jgi:hypothetical protein